MKEFPKDDCISDDDDMHTFPAGGKVPVSPCRVGHILTPKGRFGVDSLQIGFNRDSWTSGTSPGTADGAKVEGEDG